MNLGKDIALLKRMTVAELRRRYAEVFGEETRNRHKDFLVKRIAWRIQSVGEGSLSERARRRAEELASDADIRMHAPKITSLPVPAQRREGGAAGSRVVHGHHVHRDTRGIRVPDGRDGLG
jgi:hypothetical protein